MLKDVTLGRYYPIKGCLHNLDPRTKLLFLLLFIISVFISPNPVVLAFTTVVLAIVIAVSKVPLSYIFKGLRFVFTIMVFTTLLNVFLLKGSWASTFRSLYRMVAIVLASNMLTLTTRPKDISWGVEKSLSFLSPIGVPVHDIATIVSLAFRFIPILTDEAKRIMDAQKSRGAHLGEGNLREKARGIMPVIIPLFISAFRRSDELSEAMDSRLYGTGRRTEWKVMEFGRIDMLLCILSFVYLGVAIALKVVL